MSQCSRQGSVSSFFELPVFRSEGFPRPGCVLAALLSVQIRPFLLSKASAVQGCRCEPVGDKLVLRGLRFHGYHGVFEEERKLGQKFVVDVDAWLDLSKAGETDSLDDSVSYAELYRLVKEVVEGPPRALLESVASSIALEIFEKHPEITDCRVKLGKPHVAVEGVVDYLGVEILRSRPDLSKRGPVVDLTC